MKEKNNINNNKTLKYYSEWIVLFEKMKQHGINELSYNECISGTLEDRNFSLNNFKEQLVNTINILLENAINRFIKVTNLMLEVNDIYKIKTTLIDLKKQINQMMFYKELSFLEDEFIQELNKSFSENVQSFYKSLLDKVKKQTIENNVAFELYYILKKNQF